MGALEMAFNIIARDGASPAFLKVSESAKALQRTMQEADAKMSATTKAATAEMSAALAGLDRAHQSYAVQYDRANATIIASDDSVLVMQRKMAASTLALLGEQRKASAANLEMDAAMGKAQTDLAAKTAASHAARSATMKALGKGAALVTAGVIFESVKMAANFQTVTNQLVTSAGESTANIDLVRKGLLAMSGQVGVSAIDLAKGMYQVESAGFHGAKGLDVMRAAAEGAKAEGADMETVTKALTTVLNNYGTSIGGNAVKGTDFLIASVSLGKTRLQDFSAAISTVLPVGKAAGISLAEMGAAMSTMTSEGITADNAATYLRQTIVKLADQTPKAKNEMKALGLESIDVAGHLGQRGLAGTLQVLTDAIAKHLGPKGLVMLESLKHAGQNADKFQVALSNLPPAAQTYIGALTTMVGGEKTMMGALALTGDHMKTFKDDTAKIGTAMVQAGPQVNGFALVQQSLRGKLDDVKGSLTSMAIKLGDVLLPIATKVFGFLADHPGVLKALIYSIGTLLVAATVAWTAALVANPVGLFVIALGALVGAVIYSWTHFQTFRDIVTTVFTVLTNVVSGAIIGYLRYFKWFGDTVSSVAEGIGHVLLTMAQVSDRVLGTNLAGSARAGLGHMQDVRAGFDGAMNSAIGGVQDMRDKANETLRSLDGKAIKFSVTAEGVVTAAAFAAGGGVAKLGAAARFGFADGGVLPSSAMIQPATAGRGLVQWAEPSTHGEAFIPLSPSKRGRSVDIWQQTGKMLGQFADGGFTDSASGPIRTGLQNFAREVEATVAQAAQAAAKSAAMAAAVAASSAPGGKYTGAVPTGSSITRWAPLVLAVLGELGLSGGLVGKVLTQIGTESGGDPNATQGNIGDVNNASGDLARGLLQVIGTTFRANAGPYLSLGQYNPHASVYAGLHYAEGAYGPDLSFLGQGHGYALGGMPPIGVPYKVGENGAETRIDFRPGRILSHADSMKAISGRSGPLVHVENVSSGVDLSLWAQQAAFLESAGHFG